MLERILIKVLGWEVEKSKEAESFLKNHSSAIKIMPEKRVEISKYLSKKNV